MTANCGTWLSLDFARAYTKAVIFSFDFGEAD
jgi:hypothetical protein